jgi:hypothetical protein
LKTYGKQHERAQRRVDIDTRGLSNARDVQEDELGLPAEFLGKRVINRHALGRNRSKSLKTLSESLVADATELGGHEVEIKRHKAIGRRLLEENAAELHDVAVTEAAMDGVHIQVQAQASHEEHIDVTVE